MKKSARNQHIDYILFSISNAESWNAFNKEMEAFIKRRSRKKPNEGKTSNPGKPPRP